MGVGINRQCTGECGVDGNNVARAATPRWLSLAMDSQLGSADRHQHVALLIISFVKLLSWYWQWLWTALQLDR